MEQVVRLMAKDVGFAAVGITSAEPVGALAHLQTAAAAGRLGTMVWLARDPAARCDPRALLPGAQSVICCALAYDEAGLEGVRSRGARAEKVATGMIARFARGADYHDVVRERLEKLRAAIAKRAPDARTKLCVDTSPLLEKALAERAGLGWIGKHTVLLNEELGSWFVLGEIVTDLALEPDTPAQDRCGSCCACIDACPTQALCAPHELDARRCLSYLTIEHRGPVPTAPAAHLPAGSYGCDRCQEACPFNRGECRVPGTRQICIRGVIASGAKQSPQKTRGLLRRHRSSQ